ncbi:DUF397 domain-containing protein [Actinomadura parmotrematis]|uniref:DUF397 domain-containing protein n=1 Tax=Actinomadura parmotrematis TaxID=2864039 RepID=UPI0035560BA2
MGSGERRGPGGERLVLVRDSKDRDGPALAFPQPVWRRFVAEVLRGEHDLRPAPAPRA